jgi:IS605 OrfB family transposase
MACNVPRQVGATYKALWAKVRQNVSARKAGYTKKRYKGLDKAPKYVSPTLTYNFRRDYSLKAGNQVSILTLNGRIVVPYFGYNKHVALIHHGAEIGAAKLYYAKSKKQFYLLVSLKITLPHPEPTDHKQIAGVDVGQRYLAVSVNTKGETQFFPGKASRHKANRYARLRKRLQQKGTRSATRRMIAIGARERRLKLDTNHVIAKRIVERYPNALIGLEDLTGIRERTRRKHGKKATGKQRRANRQSSKWSFAELHAMIDYKAHLSGSMAIRVDANYTSKACCRCGHIGNGNRPNNGLLFVCQNCGFTLHSDLVGARNITMRMLLVRQDWASTGVLSVRPAVSNDEAKAARLQRYAELRWSSDTSPSALALGH